MPDSNSPVWFITGCSSGFGRSIALAALEAGDRVVATARDAGSIGDLARDGACVTMPLDVTDSAAIAAAVQSAVDAFGSLDVVVNNAGYGLLGSIEECSDEQLRRNMEVNYFGPLHVMRAALPIMRAQGRGHIVNISAAAAISNYAGFGAYGAAKAALELLSESVRAEVQPLGIKVTLVQPGPFRTGFIGKGMDRGASEITAYDGSVRRFGRLLAGMDGKQPGDPDLAAAAIVRMVHEGVAPLRMPLGKYAVKKLRDRSAALLREAERGEQVAGETDRT